MSNNVKFKKCKADGCHNEFRPFLSTDKYCSSSCFYKEKKKSRVKKSASKISDKKKSDLLVYKAKRLKFLSKPENKKCPVTGKPTTDIHHQKGRIGDLFLNERFWIALSREGHRKVEENPKWAKENGYSYSRLEIERWVDAFGYEGYYEVSNFGRIRSVTRSVITKNLVVKNMTGIILSQTLKKEFYLSAMLSINSVKKRVNVHRLVLQSFTRNKGLGLHCNHKNRKRNDNHIDNLEWLSPSENGLHSSVMRSNENSSLCKISNQKVSAIRRLSRINPEFDRNKIADKLSVTESTIRKIIKNQIRKF